MKRPPRKRVFPKLTREEEIQVLLKAREIAEEQNRRAAKAAKVGSLDQYEEAQYDPERLREERRKRMAEILKKNRATKGS